MSRLKFKIFVTAVFWFVAMCYHPSDLQILWIAGAFFNE